MLIFSRYCIKVVEFVAFCGKTQQFVVVSQFRESCDGRKKLTALVIVSIKICYLIWLQVSWLMNCDDMLRRPRHSTLCATVQRMRVLHESQNKPLPEDPVCIMYFESVIMLQKTNLLNSSNETKECLLPNLNCISVFNSKIEKIVFLWTKVVKYIVLCCIYLEK